MGNKISLQTPIQLCEKDQKDFVCSVQILLSSTRSEIEKVYTLLATRYQIMKIYEYKKVINSMITSKSQIAKLQEIISNYIESRTRSVAFALNDQQNQQEAFKQACETLIVSLEFGKWGISPRELDATKYNALYLVCQFESKFNEHELYRILRELSSEPWNGKMEDLQILNAPKRVMKVYEKLVEDKLLVTRATEGIALKVYDDDPRKLKDDGSEVTPKGDIIVPPKAKAKELDERYSGIMEWTKDRYVFLQDLAKQPEGLWSNQSDLVLTRLLLALTDFQAAKVGNYSGLKTRSRIELAADLFKAACLCNLIEYTADEVSSRNFPMELEDCLNKAVNNKLSSDPLIIVLRQAKVGDGVENYYRAALLKFISDVRLPNSGKVTNTEKIKSILTRGKLKKQSLDFSKIKEFLKARTAPMTENNLEYIRFEEFQGRKIIILSSYPGDSKIRNLTLSGLGARANRSDIASALLLPRHSEKDDTVTVTEIKISPNQTISEFEVSPSPESEATIMREDTTVGNAVVMEERNEREDESPKQQIVAAVKYIVPNKKDDEEAGDEDDTSSSDENEEDEDVFLSREKDDDDEQSTVKSIIKTSTSKKRKRVSSKQTSKLKSATPKPKSPRRINKTPSPKKVRAPRNSTKSPKTKTPTRNRKTPPRSSKTPQRRPRSPRAINKSPTKK